MTNIKAQGYNYFESSREAVEDLRQAVLAGARALLSDGQPRSAHWIGARLRESGISADKSLVNSTLFKEGKGEFDFDEDARTYTLPTPDYDLDEVDRRLCGTWSGQNIAALYYTPLRYRSWNDPVPECTRLILNFKNNQDLAVDIVWDYTTNVIDRHLVTLRTAYNCSYIVAVPRSRAFMPNAPVERVCVMLAKRYSWLTHLPGALVRCDSVHKSSGAYSIDERPDVALHRSTIRYKGPSLNIPDKSMIMVDDVITHGHTSEACRQVMREATNCRAVLGLFAAKTG